MFFVLPTRSATTPPCPPPGTRGIPASSVSNPAVATARFSDGEKRQIVSRMGFAPHDTQSVFQARHRKRAPRRLFSLLSYMIHHPIRVEPTTGKLGFFVSPAQNCRSSAVQRAPGTVRAGTKSSSSCFLPVAVPAQNRAHRRTVSHKSKSPDRHRVWCQSGCWAAGREWLSPFIWEHALQNKTKKGVER